jgi:hypothetical protein
MKLATARYSNPAVLTSGLVPVGFTNAYPRFIRYKLAANLREIAPDRSTIKMTDQRAFDAVYRERLDGNRTRAHHRAPGGNRWARGPDRRGSQGRHHRARPLLLRATGRTGQVVPPEHVWPVVAREDRAVRARVA